MIEVAIFSYNRGDYLAHCIASVRRNMPWAQATIYDDNSTDPATLAVLQTADLPVYRRDSDSRARHGGLYANMQWALDQTTADLIFFLQEDMQIVRPVDAADLHMIDALFAQDPARAFVCPVFMKGIRRKTHQASQVPSPDLRAYVAPPGMTRAQRKSIYSDVSIGHVARLRAAGWRFQATEVASKELARTLFADMPYLADSFAFYCPQVPVFRNRSSTLAARLAARVSGTDVKALHDMTAEQARDFRQRPLTVWPIAETFLRPVDPKVRRPFVYKDVKVRWWINLLYRLETSLRR